MTDLNKLGTPWDIDEADESKNLETEYCGVVKNSQKDKLKYFFRFKIKHILPIFKSKYYHKIVFRYIFVFSLLVGALQGWCPEVISIEPTSFVFGYLICFCFDGHDKQ